MLNGRNLKKCFLSLTYSELYDPWKISAISWGTLWSGYLLCLCRFLPARRDVNSSLKALWLDMRRMVNNPGRIISQGNPWRTGTGIWSKAQVYGRVGWTERSSLEGHGHSTTRLKRDVRHWGKPVVVWMRNVPYKLRSLHTRFLVGKLMKL